jgi:hypothetical protein
LATDTISDGKLAAIAAAGLSVSAAPLGRRAYLARDKRPSQFSPNCEHAWQCLVRTCAVTVAFNAQGAMMQVVIERCAGLDVHQETVVACRPVMANTRCFPTSSPG